MFLQNGEVLNLQAKCDGTPPHDYCYTIVASDYKQTGNETCDRWTPLDQCNFNIVHFSAMSYKVLVIVRNRVAQVNREVAIKVYTERRSQLSVIVVPVAFCLVAVILVVFGVAYYMQNKTRWVIYSCWLYVIYSFSDCRY